MISKPKFTGTVFSILPVKLLDLIMVRLSEVILSKMIREVLYLQEDCVDWNGDNPVHTSSLVFCTVVQTKLIPNLIQKTRSKSP